MNAQYKYKPETVSDDYIDWVIFIEPDTIVIERVFKNKKIKKCTSNLFSSPGSNAWTKEDIKNALAKDGIAQLFKRDGSVFTIEKTTGGEGGKAPFVIIHNNVTVTIMPPGTEVKNSLTANKDIADMVYVLSKIYRQQLVSKACLPLDSDK